MRRLDTKDQGRLCQYLAQCGMATLAGVVIMLSLDVVVRRGAITASLGASTFIVFVMPQGRTAEPRSIALGYVIGGVAGCLLSVAVTPLSAQMAITEHLVRTVFGALAVGSSTFAMVLLDAEHPPAAGFALGLVLGKWTMADLGAVAMAVGLLVFARLALGRRLVDLL